MRHSVRTLTGLGQGQRLRLAFGDTTVDVRVNQIEYTPGDRLRLELTTDGGDDSRYLATATADGGEWSALAVRRYDRTGDGWQSLGTVETVTPLETFRTVSSSDMRAQENTGTVETLPGK
jgi:hypothetical protein